MTPDGPSGRISPPKAQKKLTPEEQKLSKRLDKRFKKHEKDPLMMFVKKTAFKKLLARMRNAS